MASFSVEFERTWLRRAKELGRDLTTEERATLEAAQFQEWIDTNRLDELIRMIHANYGREGGLDDIQALGYHLRKTSDIERVHVLHRGLISTRVNAFYDWWPRASEGNIGCMHSAARSVAEAMQVYVEYFASLDSLGLTAEREALREEMQRFQARQPLKDVLPRPTMRARNKRSDDGDG